MFYRHCRLTVLIGLTAVVSAILLVGQNVEKLTEEQMRNFLCNARVERGREIGKGITRPYRLTLNDGTITHDGSFQWIDEYKASMEFDNGQKEMNFRDSYKYSIAAYELAKLLGIGDMMPVTVERKWEGKKGALSWWLPAKMDELQRQAKHLDPPNPEAWAKQYHKMLVFSQLVYDTDRNLGNLLISEDWHLWMIDFSRAFRLYTTLQDPKRLTRCDRQLLQKLRQLDAAEVQAKAGKWLNSPEIKGLMARRDRIVAFFDALAAKKGQGAVLYD